MKKIYLLLLFNIINASTYKIDKSKIEKEKSYIEIIKEIFVYVFNCPREYRNN